MIPPAEIKFL